MPQKDDIYGLIVQVNQVWIALFKRERFQGDFPLPSYFVSCQTLSAAIIPDPIGLQEQYLPKSGPALSCIALAIRNCQEQPSGTTDELMTGTKYRTGGFELWRLHNQFLPSAELPFGFNFRLEGLTIRAHRSVQRIFTMVAKEKLARMQTAIKNAQVLFDKRNDPQIDPEALKKALQDLNQLLRKVTAPTTDAKQLSTQTAPSIKKLKAGIDALKIEDTPLQRKEMQKVVDTLSGLAGQAFNTLMDEDAEKLQQATKTIFRAVQKFKLPDQTDWKHAEQNVKTASYELTQVFQRDDVNASSSSVIRIYHENPLKTQRDLQLAWIQVVCSYITSYDASFPIPDAIIRNSDYREDLYAWYQIVLEDMPNELSDCYDYISRFEDIQTDQSKQISGMSFYLDNLYKQYLELQNPLNPTRYNYLHLINGCDELKPDQIEKTIEHVIGLLDLHRLRLKIQKHLIIKNNEVLFPLKASASIQSCFDRQFFPLCAMLLIEWSKTCDATNPPPPWIDNIMQHLDKDQHVRYEGHGSLDRSLFHTRAASKQTATLEACKNLGLDTAAAEAFNYENMAISLQSAVKNRDITQIKAQADFTEFSDKLDELLAELDNLLNYGQFFEDLFQENKTLLVDKLDQLKKLGFKPRLMADFSRLLIEANSQPKKQLSNVNQSLATVYSNLSSMPCETSYEKNQRDAALKLLQQSQAVLEPDFLEDLQKHIENLLTEVETTPLDESTIQAQLQATKICYQTDRRKLAESLKNRADVTQLKFGLKQLRIALLRELVTSDLNQLAVLLKNRQHDRQVMQARAAVEELKPELVMTEWLQPYNSIAPFVKWRGDSDPYTHDNNTHLPIGKS